MNTNIINYYRLGDLVYHNYLNRDEEDKILKYHSNSLGSKYIIEKRKNNFNNDTNYRLLIITKIILEYIPTIINKIPKDIIESLLIHLRLGDVVGGKIWHEIGRRPFEINHLNNLIEDDNKKGNKYKNKYIIGKCHFGENCSTNYEECIDLSNKYLNNCLELFKASHLNSDNADIDLCCAILSKNFIQGRGCYSQLIVAIRNRLGLENIKNEDEKNKIQETIDNNEKIKDLYKNSFETMKNYLNFIKNTYFISNSISNSNSEKEKEIKPVIIYISRNIENDIESFIEYYLNLGFEYIYIYEIFNFMPQYEKKLKKQYSKIKIYILPNNISYNNNNINNEIINNFETNIFNKTDNSHYLYINDDNEKKIKDYFESIHCKNIKNYIKYNNLKDKNLLFM